MSADKSRSVEELLMKSLRYSSGLDKEKLSELVTLATKLLEEVRRGSQTSSSSKAPQGTSQFYQWWWIYGVPVIDTIGLEITLGQQEVERLIAVIHKMPDVRDVMGPIELVPSALGQEPTPDPWKLRTSFGAKAGPGPPNPWKEAFTGHTHG